ncbi:small cell adhesion glycoprotein [Rana temporaria]|uniref:small cell adhesion glycoprotein n=1 Tax=Rana temporaria TaxID=8407 RepID=UPI001AAD0FE9|nr:small cell adhesion glycoprotein [Rana temporaria]XP_040196771.1 small cell adhesion glycoprotein [Rana temporaria]
MALATTADFATVVKATVSSADMDVDASVIAGVIAAVVITILVVMALIAVYLYKHKGSYRTHETVEEGEADKSLQEKGDPSEEKQEYFM